LLQTFPAAAFEGVQWEVLVSKYESRHSAKLDLASLGYNTALAAASSLLWEVLRVVNAEDVDNPVIAVEYGVALTPRVGYLACWPSLYVAMCGVVSRSGVPDDQLDFVGDTERPRGLLLSQLKPLLQSEWHADFSECGLTYISESGGNVQMKKMKHLVTAVLRWRAQYVERRAAQPRRNALEAALTAAQLVLVPSKKHNDLVLRCLPSGCADPQGMVAAAPTALLTAVPPVPTQLVRSASTTTRWCDVDVSETDDLWSDVEVKSTSTSVARSETSYEDLECEVAALRAENASLKDTNLQLVFKGLFGTSADAAPVGEPEIFDDPFEPPPEARMSGSHWGFSPTASSTSSCNFSLGGSSIGTPISSSGAATPTVPCAPGPMGFSGPTFTFVPVWGVIPAGVVQKAKTFFEKTDEGNFTGQTTQPARSLVQRAKSLFEKTDEAMPSFFVRPNIGSLM
jgi:hypothetical protein